ncbi:hypothetical protein [Pedobacter sp. GR22-6]|uniref:hypothetical protein n=1 Tax=Pedobacter sp. GR22-6 TaxID=3127957 RepID=UPI00307E07B6
MGFLSKAQQIPATARAAAINAGTLQSHIPYASAASSQGLPNYVGFSSPDLLHKFVLSDSAIVSIGHCETEFATGMYLINSSGFIITNAGENTPLCSRNRSSMVNTLGPGTYYYVLSKRSGAGFGLIRLTINLRPLPKSLSEQLSEVFGSLELSRVPYGLLRDIAIEQAELSNHQGALLGDSTLVEQVLFNSLYSTLMTSRVDNSAYNFQDVSKIDSIALINRQPGRVLIHLVKGS